MRIALCDDNGSDRDKIESILVEYSERKACDFEYLEYGSGHELLEALKDNDIPEIILLDINMDDIDGLTVAGKIREMLPDIPIVLITAFMSYALDGYKVKANRFLIKDDLKMTLPDCMDDMIQELSRRVRTMTFDFEEGIRMLPLDSITYVESYGHKAIFHTADATYRQNRKLEEIERELDIYDFVRVHKSFVVNMKYVLKVNNYSLTLQEGSVISVPRSRYADVKQAYARYRGAHI
ncbi:MAG: response regulator transcription factor [Oribacterium sp.]|nr:response regulator transcription factor [Oribacterium sp.]MBP3804799.1 response regulator transcription factor [Oribacterium sp.]